MAKWLREAQAKRPPAPLSRAAAAELVKSELPRTIRERPRLRGVRRQLYLATSRLDYIDPA